MDFGGGRFSKSRGTAVDVPYFLSRYDPDPLCYYLTATAPETRDTEFSWEDFVERNNHVLSEAERNELVAMWGNLANRMLSFAYKRFDGKVPELAPILPHTAQQLHEYLGYDGQLFGTQQVMEYEEEARSHRALTYDHSEAVGTWAPSALPVGQALRQPAPLFRKLDESLIDEEYERIAG